MAVLRLQTAREDEGEEEGGGVVVDVEVAAVHLKVLVSQLFFKRVLVMVGGTLYLNPTVVSLGSLQKKNIMSSSPPRN
jgi:hypothetical protein